ncbi:MAG: exodeoxyribonuclease VII large subunit [Oscillospiraceae bacterium]|nr:exodeoxyribonuclease VII large subunit [Oscillospiraceae bacterium]
MSSILTVSQINTYLSFKIKNDPKLKGVAIKGEISNLSVNQKSGHIYFTLKDASSALKAVMFYSNVARLKFMPLPGQSVVAFGNIDVYERDGVYQIIVNELLPVGEGESYIALAKLKAELEALGVFSAHKKEICKYPQKIAVVTSANGAALQDIINIISRRYPIVKLSVFSTLVQGVYAPASISKSLAEADKSGADTIILARGGGSSEDLAAFNTKDVTLAVFNCKTPVISAVGHETDWSLADLAADLRAPTPSGAAELAVPDIQEILGEIKLLKSQMNAVVSSKIKLESRMLASYSDMLKTLSPKRKVDDQLYEVKIIEKSINQSALSKMTISRLALESVTEMLESLNPLNIINRGYAAVLVNGKMVSSIDSIAINTETEVLIKGGSFKAKVTEITKTEN